VTFGTTHLGISLILFYILTPNKLRNWAKENPILFFFTTLFTIIPDIDLYLPIPHRSYTHSLIVICSFVIIFSLILTTLDRYLSEEKNFSMRCFLNVAAFFWITHVLYDLTFGPIGLFYPLDKRFYDLTIGIRVGLDSEFVSFRGFFANPIFLTPGIGVRIFFVNWTAEERVSHFGTDTINFSITDFFLHVTIFLFYIHSVVFPALKKTKCLLLKKQIINPYYNNIVIKLNKIQLRNFRLQNKLIIIMFILLMLSGLTFGQLSEKYYEQTSSRNHQFFVLSDGHSVYNQLTYTLPFRAESEFELLFRQSSITYKVAWGIANSTVSTFVSSSLDNLTKSYRDGNITAVELAENFQNSISTIIPSNWEILTINSSIGQNGLTRNYGFSESDLEGSFNAGFGILLIEWPHDSFFIRSFSSTISININRTTEYNIGNVVMIVPLLLIFLTIALEMKFLNNSKNISK
jgi:hypothetical protein